MAEPADRTDVDALIAELQQFARSGVYSAFSWPTEDVADLAKRAAAALASVREERDEARASHTEWFQEAHELSARLRRAEDALRRIASGKVHYKPFFEASAIYMMRTAAEALAAADKQAGDASPEDAAAAEGTGS